MWTLLRQVLLAVDRVGGTVGGEPERAATGRKQEACEGWDSGKECTEGMRRMSESKTGRPKEKELVGPSVVTPESRLFPWKIFFMCV